MTDQKSPMTDSQRHAMALMRSMAARKKVYRLRRANPTSVGRTRRAVCGGETAEPGGPDPAVLEAQLKAREQEVEQVKQAVLRARADMDNLRKRAAREREQTQAFAIESLLRDLVPVVDNFDRALSSIDTATNPRAFVDGVRMISAQLFGALQGRGVSKVSPIGEKFDPTLHEAVATIPPGPGEEEGIIVDVVAAGYVLNGRVVRPAMVRITRS